MRFLILLALIPLRLVAWENHGEITAHILSKAPKLETRVAYVPLATALSHGLSTTRARTLSDFRAWLKINKKYAFPNKLGEAVGKFVEPRKVLAMYSDEPDWGLDQELFSADQYPELWNADSQYVGGQTGLKSQGFRHMYFPGRWHPREPFASFQIPMHPLGEAPTRAALYFDLARDFFQRGQIYWGYRFTAWAIHITEDLFQPFHARQTPSKAFIVLRWWPPGIDIPKTAEKIGYYHLSYEQWVNHETMDPNGPLAVALGDIVTAPPFDATLKDFLANHVVDYSSSRATEVGETTRKIFPAFDLNAGIPAEKFVGTPDWWEKVKYNPAMPDLIRTTRVIFSHMGQIVRRIVVEAHPH